MTSSTTPSTMPQPNHETPTWISSRVRAMPRSIFEVLDGAKTRARQQGKDLIDLSIGSSDLAPPPQALKALHDTIDDPSSYGYCLYSKTEPLRQAVVAWHQRRYPEAPALEADQHALGLIGSQEGFFHLLQATCDPGDLIVLPDPSYPVYMGAVALAGLETYTLALSAEHDFLPQLDAIPPEIAQRAKVMVLSYPNNPTSAVVDDATMQQWVDYCLQHDILLVHDFPYMEMTFGDYRAPSILNQQGALDTAVEIYSASKSFHMAGFRLGWALGNSQVIQALRKVKSAVDFNQYLGIQHAVIAALKDYVHDDDRATLEARRDALVGALAQQGWHIPLPKASMFTWAKLPPAVLQHYEVTAAHAGLSACVACCLDMIAMTGVCAAPGSAFGEQGSGYLRLALVQEPERLREAAQRIGAHFQALGMKGGH